MDATPTSTAADPSEEVRATLGIGPSARRKHRWLRIGAITLIVAGLAAALIWWLRRPEPSPEWETVALGRGDIPVGIDATGTLEPERTVSVGAEISGRVVSVEVEEDERVEAGQLLARFDLESLEGELREAKASLGSARAEIRRAKAQLADAKLQLERTEELRRSGVASREELEQRETARSLASADLSRARAQAQLARARVDQIETRITKAEIHAPITGVVLTRDVEPGKAIAASFQTPELFSIAADLTHMKLELPIDEADIGEIAVGQRARFYVDAWPEREFTAELTKLHLAPELSGNVVTYVAELSVDNGEGLLRPGMTATATIDVGVERDVLRIPVAALRFSPPQPDAGGFRFGPPQPEQKHASGSAVWVLRKDEEGVAAPLRIAIDVGASDGEWYAVEGGDLREGEAILVGAKTGGR